jgi:hypothetical protein
MRFKPGRRGKVKHSHRGSTLAPRVRLGLGTPTKLGLGLAATLAWLEWGLGRNNGISNMTYGPR